MKIQNIKNIALAATMAIMPLGMSRIHARQNIDIKPDTFERVITPDGSTDSTVLAYAPSPDISVKGKNIKAGIVIDITKNILYTYDKDGNPTKAYLVASGKKSTPTPDGIYRVTHKEVYPYKTAPRGTKRRRSPKDYGKYIVCLTKVIDPKLGLERNIGIFVHGCKSYHDTFEVVPDRRVSHGCVRLSEKAIEEVKEVTPNTYILFKY